MQDNNNNLNNTSTGGMQPLTDGLDTSPQTSSPTTTSDLEVSHTVETTSPMETAPVTDVSPVSEVPPVAEVATAPEVPQYTETPASAPMSTSQMDSTMAEVSTPAETYTPVSEQPVAQAEVSVPSAPAQVSQPAPVQPASNDEFVSTPSVEANTASTQPAETPKKTSMTQVIILVGILLVLVGLLAYYFLVMK